MTSAIRRKESAHRPRRAAAPRGRGLESQPVQARRIKGVHGGPAVGPVTDIRGNTAATGDGDESRNEPVMVQCAVHGRGEPDDRGTDAALRECDDRVLGVDARAGAERVGFDEDTAQTRETEGSRRPDQRLAGAGQGMSERLDDPQIGRDRTLVITGGHRVVLEGQVDDTVGRRGGSSEAGGIVQVPRCTWTPAADSAAAEVSEGARPTT